MTASKRQNIAFIVGVGRSGTSLLQSMMNAHPRISFAPETQFVRSHLLCKNRARSWDDTKKCIKQDERLIETFGDAEELNACVENLPRNDAETFYHTLLDRFSNEDAFWSGDKDPRLLEKSDELLETFPSAKIIHILRDPRDVICSKIKAGWSRNRPWWLQVFVSMAQLEFIQPNTDRFLTVSYEALINAPEVTLCEVCQFLDLEFSPKMLDFHDSAKELMRESEAAWKQNTTRPLIKGNSGVWKTELSAFQIALTEAVMFTHPVIRNNYQKSPQLNRFSLYAWLSSTLGKLFIPISNFMYRILLK